MPHDAPVFVYCVCMLLSEYRSKYATLVTHQSLVYATQHSSCDANQLRLLHQYCLKPNQFMVMLCVCVC